MELVDELVFKDGTKKIIDECINTVKKYDEVVIFGAGVGGEALYHLLEETGNLSSLVAWADNNIIKHGKSYMREDLLVIPPSKIKEYYGAHVCVIIASSAYDVIKEQLVKLGISDNNIYLYNFAFMDLKYTDMNFIKDNLESFNRAFERMADVKSQKIFIDILNYRATKDISFLEDMHKYVDDEKCQYFPKDLFEFKKDEKFLDVGAYTGDTFESFCETYSGGWDYYCGLEADFNVYKELHNKVKDKDVRNKVSLINAAAWNEEAELFFDSVAGSTKMLEKNEDKENCVKAIRIDDIEIDSVSLVKMDIEGAEYNALSGMTNLIKKDKPILAICVYHRRDDFFRLTDLIEEIYPKEYVYYLRQYRYTPTETVCYAIPSDRIYAH